MDIDLFEPSYGRAQETDVTTTAQSFTLTSNGGRSMCLTVSGTQEVYYRITTNDDTSDAQVNIDPKLLPNSQISVGKLFGNKRISFIAKATGSRIHAVEGRGA